MKKRTLEELSFYVEQAKKLARSQAKNRESLVKIMMGTGYAGQMNTLAMIDIAEVILDYSRLLRPHNEIVELKNKIDLWKSYNLEEV